MPPKRVRDQAVPLSESLMARFVTRDGNMGQHFRELAFAKQATAATAAEEVMRRPFDAMGHRC